MTILKLVLVIVGLVLAACSDDTPTSSATNQSADEIRAEVFLQTGIDLVPIDFFGWDLELSDIAGQVVVMNFWTSWCIPCLDSMPVMLDISENYSANDVRFISVNLDDYEDEDAYISALDFLSSTNARIENYQLQQDLFEIYQFFALENIPTIIIYSRAGDEYSRLHNEGDLLPALLSDAINQSLALPIEE